MFIPQTIWDIVARQARERPNAEALVARDGRLTFAEVAAATERAASALYGLGVRPGDHVGVSTRNGLQAVITFLGAMRIGAVWVGFHRALPPGEKSRLFNRAKVTLYLGDDATAAEIVDSKSVFNALDFDHEWCPLTARADGAAVPDIAVDPFAPAAIGWTSGTSGTPKGAVHSQSMLMLPGAALGSLWGPEARHGTVLSLNIINPMILGPLLSLQSGVTNVIMDVTHAIGIADWVERERVTTLMCVPTMLYDLTHEPSVDRVQLETLTWTIVGGAHPAETTLDAYAAKFGVRPLGCYGLTEAPSVVSLATPQDSACAGSSGAAAPHLDIRILGDDGEPLPAGETGEISIGPRADSGSWAGAYRPFLGYFEQPEATADALRGDWFLTGDIGYLDTSGRLFVTGRRSDMILRGGANIYPAEIEAVLQAIPSVAAAAVIGRPDERLGETVIAFVEPAAGTTINPDSVREFCETRLAKYKVPSVIYIIKSFERTALGKINKILLKNNLLQQKY